MAFNWYLLDMVSQDVSPAIVQRRLPGHDNKVLSSVHNPWGGRARRHCWGEGGQTLIHASEITSNFLSFQQ